MPALTRFGEQFLAAFDRLDRGDNWLTLLAMREALSNWDRAEFDEHLNTLRDIGLVSCDTHEGLYGTCTQAMKDAGIREGHELFIYVSRRH